jgi:gamma-glutamyl hercynylcysteine S-oxide synthase
MAISPISLTPGKPIQSVMTRGDLINIMREFRSRTLDLVADLSDEQMIGPRLPIVNPPLWEIGHVAWTQEFWVLRHLRNHQPLMEGSDQIYNSTDVAHDTRWELLLPSRQDTLRYMEAVLSRAMGELDDVGDLSSNEFYFYLLATFHEGMHAEALAYTRQTLGYAAPRFSDAPPKLTDHHPPAAFRPDDVEIPGGTFLIGATPDFPFAFDNEKWAHPAEVKPFRIAPAPVTNGEYLAFVEDGGYQKPQFWSAEGWRWLEVGGAPQLETSFAKFFNRNMKESGEAVDSRGKLEHPLYWRREASGRWLQRTFDQYVPLKQKLPVVHVSWYEAQAYCTWAGRRLPSEAEWEMAASAEPGAAGRRIGDHRRHFPWGDTPPTPERANLDWHNSGLAEVDAYPKGDSASGCRQMLGNVWEWTADDFLPYPGFAVDPYKEYSKPWFGTHKVLRGGCWATRSLLIRNTWRNFYTPDRNDVWAGFRTCTS